MSDRLPIETTNLDRYGSDVLPWSRARDLLAAPAKPDAPQGSGAAYLGTCGPDGKPHAAGIGPLWHEGDLYFTSGPGTRKSRHLAANPACTLALSLPGLDLVFEGEADRVTDTATLEALAAGYRQVGWPAEAADDALTAPYSAPTAGPPPWYLYRLRYHTVFGVAGGEPHGATRWRFAR